MKTTRKQHNSSKLIPALRKARLQLARNHLNWTLTQCFLVGLEFVPTVLIRDSYCMIWGCNFVEARIHFVFESAVGRGR